MTGTYVACLVVEPLQLELGVAHLRRNRLDVRVREVEVLLGLVIGVEGVAATVPGDLVEVMTGVRDLA